MNRENRAPERAVANPNENANKEKLNTAFEGNIVYYHDRDGDYHIEQDDEAEEADDRDCKHR